MFAASLDWKQRSDMLARLFPQNDDLIVAVVNARTPEQADETSASLAAAVDADRVHFESVRRPDALAYLRRNAFLLIDPATLQSVLDSTVDAQPFLGQLVADPSLRGRWKDFTSGWPRPPRGIRARYPGKCCWAASWPSRRANTALC
jgi:hypothetical protein